MPAGRGVQLWVAGALFGQAICGYAVTHGQPQIFKRGVLVGGQVYLSVLVHLIERGTGLGTIERATILCGIRLRGKFTELLTFMDETSRLFGC